MANGDEGRFNDEGEKYSMPTSTLTLRPSPHSLKRAYWEQSEVGGPVSYADFTVFLARRRRLITSVFLLVLLATVIYIVRSPRKYEAELKLLIKRARADEIVSTEKDTSSARAAEITESQIRSEIELILSRTLLEKVAEECELALPRDDRRSLIQAVFDLQKHIRAAPITKTNLISVKYTSTDPEQGSRVLKSLSALYLEKHVAVYRNHDASAVFAQEAAAYQQQLNAAEQRLAAFEQQYEASLLNERKAAGLKRVVELEVARQEIDAQIRDAEDRAQQLELAKNSLPISVETQSRTALNETLIEQLKTTLLALHNKRTELLTKYDPSYRLVQEVDQQIEDTRKALEREQTPTVVERTDQLNPLRQSVEGELLRTQALRPGLRARRAALSEQLNDILTKQKTLERLTGEHDELARQVKLHEENYLLYQKKKEELRIADTLDRHKILNVSIVDEPAAPTMPNAGHRGFALLLGLMAATFASLGAAGIAQHLDPPISSAAELKACTGLPVLATVSMRQSGEILVSSLEVDGKEQY